MEVDPIFTVSCTVLAWLIIGIFIYFGLVLRLYLLKTNSDRPYVSRKYILEWRLNYAISNKFISEPIHVPAFARRETAPVANSRRILFLEFKWRNLTKIITEPPPYQPNSLPTVESGIYLHH